MSHVCLLCDPEEGDGTSSEVCEEWLEDWQNPLTAWECQYPGACLCPHPNHQGWECFTVDDV